MRNKHYGVLAVLIVASFAAAALGGAATATSVGTWYATLQKPAWNPPNWLFGPVWTTLYVLMAVAAWRAWGAAPSAKEARTTLALHGVQLVLNTLWSVLFFGLRRPDLAFAEVLVFWLLLVGLLVRFARADRLAALLWTPYVLWVSFASVLNGTIWWLNR